MVIGTCLGMRESTIVGEAWNMYLFAVSHLGEGLGFWGLGFCFRLRVSCFRFQVPGSGVRVPGFGFRVPGFGYGVLGPGFHVSCVGPPLSLSSELACAVLRVKKRASTVAPYLRILKYNR